MSPLWMNCKIKQPITNLQRPSPKQQSDYQSFARSLKSCLYRHIPRSKTDYNTIKGISLFASLPRQVEASMTVEASVVLPLFLFFFLNLGCAIEMIRLHSNLEFALCDIGKRMAVYGYVMEEDQEQAETASGLLGELEDFAFSYTYVRDEIIDYLGADYLENSPLAEGSKGLQFLESEIFDNGDCFEMVVTYKVAPLNSIVGVGAFRMANKYYGHLWNGYRIPRAEELCENETIVYVAENGIVYHESEECSHLLLSVHEVSLQEAYDSRNMDGGRYTLCMRCGKGEMKRNVYITDEGDNFHYSEDCPGLKRTIYVMTKEAAEKYRPCGRCAQK